jgi:tripartite-type tricarboxylate transporter receptor subunit TctC
MLGEKASAFIVVEVKGGTMMKRMLRKGTGVCFISVMISVFCSQVTLAQDFPTKPISLIIPFGAGGASDIISRGITANATKYLGQPVVINIKPGGGGAIGTDSVARANPDGYTLLFGHTNCNTILPVMERRSKGPDDLAAVCRINSAGGIFVAQPDAPFKTFKEMIAWAKEHPGELTFGTVGTWSVTDFLWKQVEYKYGIKTRSVTYPGGGEALTAILGGHIQVIAVAPQQSLKHIQAGKLHPLAVVEAKRLQELPNVPLATEEGFDTTIGIIWQGVLAPLNTPRPIINKLAAAFRQMTEAPEAVAMMKKFSDEFDYLGPDAFEKEWRTEYETYKKLGQIFKK